VSRDSKGPLDREACLAYLSENTFRLRPSDYGQKYPKWPGAVGLEIEMLPVDPRDHGSPVPGPVPLYGPGLSTSELLQAAAPSHGWTPRTDSGTDKNSAGGTLMSVLMDQGDALTFEPGGQLEFSSAPYPCLCDAVKRMNEVQSQIDRIYSDCGLAIAQVGINPWHTLGEIGLQMPKPRYRAMDQYYSQIGPYGQRMMRQTCTVQVNLDFGPDEMTLAKRYLASQLVSPLAAAMFAYSPVVDRKLTGVRGFRSRIWRHTDPTHTGLPGLKAISARLDRSTCISTYLEAVLGATVVFIEDLNYQVLAKPLTFGEWLDHSVEGVRPTVKDLATHLSLMFPEVRPRGFLELRSIDCQARAWQYVPAYFYTGLLYDRETLDQVIDLLLPYGPELENLLVKAEQGLEDPTLAMLSARVIQLVQSGFSRLSPCFKAGGAEREFAAFAANFTLKGRTPADDVLDAVHRSKDSFMTFATYRSLEERWATYSV
jgi:glutamate--cysteine ligase